MPEVSRAKSRVSSCSKVERYSLGTSPLPSEAAALCQRLPPRWPPLRRATPDCARPAARGSRWLAAWRWHTSRPQVCGTSWHRLRGSTSFLLWPPSSLTPPTLQQLSRRCCRDVGCTGRVTAVVSCCTLQQYMHHGALAVLLSGRTRARFCRHPQTRPTRPRGPATRSQASLLTCPPFPPSVLHRHPCTRRHARLPTRVDAFRARRVCDGHWARLKIYWTMCNVDYMGKIAGKSYRRAVLYLH